VIDARCGDEALRICAATPDPIHLLLTDVVMPGLSGPQLAKRVATSRPGTAVLFMSGYAEGALVHQGVVPDDVSILQKPFSPAHLAHKVRHVLGARALSPLADAHQSGRPLPDLAAAMRLVLSIEGIVTVEEVSKDDEE
jgi:YesN/AraC family two-component response regulator